MQPPSQGRRAALLLLLLAAACLLLPSALLLSLAALPRDVAADVLRGLGGRAFFNEYGSRVLARLTLPNLAPLLAALPTGLLLVWQRQRLATFLMGLAPELRRDGASLWGALALARAERWTMAGVFGCLALGGALRLAFLFQPMRYDEASTYAMFAPSALTAISQYQYPNNHVFHTLLVHVSARLFGDAPWALRLPAFFAGVLLIPAVYLLGRLLYNPATGWTAAGLVAGSSSLVEYSTNARGYAVGALLIVLQAALGAALLRRHSVLAWAAFAGAAALAAWTVPTMVLGTASVVLWLAACALARGVAPEYRGTFWRWLAGSCAVAGGLTLLLYAPVIVVSGPASLFSNRFVRPLGWGEWGGALPASLASTWGQWNRDLAPSGFLLAAGFLAGLALHRRTGRQGMPLALLTVLACALFAVARRVAPPERVWLFVLPLYLLTAAAGLVAFVRLFPVKMRSGLGAGGASLVLLAGLQTLLSGSVLSSTDTGTLRDAPQVVEVLRERLRPGDRVVAACPSDAVLEYYFRRRGIPTAHLSMAGPSGLPEGGRVFLIVNKAHGQTLAALEARARREQVVDRGSVRLVHASDSAAVYEMAPRAAGRPARESATANVPGPQSAGPR